MTVLNDPFVLLFDKNISNVRDLLPAPAHHEKAGRINLMPHTP
jgi:hypothetical protein